MKLPPLTNKAIKAYVEALPPDEPCAYRSDPQRCIVARYIEAALDEDQTPHYMVTVGASMIEVKTWDEQWRSDGKRRWRPSSIIQQIVHRFDALPQQMPRPADVLPIFDKEPTQ
jgi:hypothetical protein